DRRGEAVGDPAQDFLPEDRKLVKGCLGWDEQVGTIREDREDQARSQSAAHIRGEASTWRGKAFDKSEGPLGTGKPFQEVCGSFQRRGEPIAQPSERGGGMEQCTVEADWEPGGGVSSLLGPPVDELSLGDGKGNSHTGRLPGK